MINMWATLESNSFHTIFCLISGMCCLLPLYLSMPSNIEDTQLPKSLSSSPGFVHTSFASLTAVIPLFFDVLLDISSILITKWAPLNINSSRVRQPHAKKNIRFTFFNIPERLILFAGVIVVPLVAVLPTDTKNLGLIYLCCSKCQKNLLGGVIASFLCRYDKEYWSVKFTLFSLLSFSIGLIGGTFVDNIFASSTSSNRIFLSIDLIVVALTIAPCLVMMINSIRWLIIVYFKAFSWKGFMMCSSTDQLLTDSNAIAVSKDLDDTFFPMVYIVCVTCLIILILSLSVTTFRVQNYTGRDLSLHNVPVLIFVISLNTLSMRMVKSEILEGMYALIDSKKSYVRYISHELRTPLNAAFLGIKLLSDSLRTSNNPDDMDRREILADVNVACRTTLDILNDLLCFDKMESGILVVHKHEVPVLSFISDCVSMFSAQAREANVNLLFSGGGGHCDEIHSLVESDAILIDKFKMDQVLRNLISNSLKFTPRGGTVTVTSSFIPDSTGLCLSPRGESAQREILQLSSVLTSSSSILNGFRRTLTRKRSADLKRVCDSPLSTAGPVSATHGKLVIVVKDTGSGMIEEDYSRLFKEIIQFNPEVLQAGGGSGLGLWITKGIVDLHQGQISVHSEGLGCGSSFTVELPMTRDSLFSSQTMPPSDPDVISSPRSLYASCPSQAEIESETVIYELDVEHTVEPVMSQSVYHLLIVDDSSLNRKMLLRIFRAAGHTCEEAEDGVIAVAKVKEMMSSSAKAYSAILMDFVMPNMDGPTATKEIRSLGYTAPIYGVTGNTLNTDIDFFMESGADKVLPKPFDKGIFDATMMKP